MRIGTVLDFPVRIELSRDAAAIRARLFTDDAGECTMGSHACLRAEGGNVASPSRHRATVDLRGIEGRLQAFATARRMTVAASVRRAVEAMLAGEGMVASDAPAVASAAADGVLVKLTLRLPAAHVQLLIMRARRADVSQGAYVAGLIEGTPLAPRPPDHREVLRAIARSTSDLAALSVDLRELLRRLRRADVGDCAQQLAALSRSEAVVNEHVRLASWLVADVRVTRPASTLDRGRRARAERRP